MFLTKVLLFQLVGLQVQVQVQVLVQSRAILLISRMRSLNSREASQCSQYSQSVHRPSTGRVWSDQRPKVVKSSLSD